MCNEVSGSWTRSLNTRKWLATWCFNYQPGEPKSFGALFTDIWVFILYVFGLDIDFILYTEVVNLSINETYMSIHYHSAWFAYILCSNVGFLLISFSRIFFHRFHILYSGKQIQIFVDSFSINCINKMPVNISSQQGRILINISRCSCTVKWMATQLRRVTISRGNTYSFISLLHSSISLIAAYQFRYPYHLICEIFLNQRCSNCFKTREIASRLISTNILNYG